MIELEVLVEVFDSYDMVEKVLSDFEFVEEEIINDKYFYDPLRNNLKPDASGKTFQSLRIRNKNNKTKLTYKKDVYKDKIWQYSDENELIIENADQMNEIFSNLGFKELVVINNYRKYYKYKQYEIILEKVDNLGVFLEVEYKGELTACDINEKRKEITAFISSMNINVSSELNAGKPELFIKKHNLVL